MLSDIPTRRFQLFFHRSISTPSHRHHTPSLWFPQGQVVCTVDCHKHGKGISTRRCGTSSTAISPLTNAPTQSGSSMCSTPAMNLLQCAQVPNRCCSASVNSRQASSFHTSTSSTVIATPVSGNRLSSSQTSSKNPAAHWLPEFYVDFTSHIWITYRSHFHPI